MVISLGVWTPFSDIPIVCVFFLHCQAYWAGLRRCRTRRTPSWWNSEERDLCRSTRPTFTMHRAQQLMFSLHVSRWVSAFWKPVVCPELQLALICSLDGLHRFACCAEVVIKDVAGPLIEASQHSRAVECIITSHRKQHASTTKQDLHCTVPRTGQLPNSVCFVPSHRPEQCSFVHGPDSLREDQLLPRTGTKVKLRNIK